MNSSRPVLPPKGVFSLQEMKILLRTCQALEARCIEYSGVRTFIGGELYTSKCALSLSSDEAVCLLLCQPSCQSVLTS